MGYSIVFHRFAGTNGVIGCHYKNEMGFIVVVDFGSGACMATGFWCLGLRACNAYGLLVSHGLRLAWACSAEGLWGW